MAKRSKGDGGVYEEPDGSFRAIVYIDGRPVKRRADTREAAEALRQELIALRDQGIDVASGGQTLETWLLTWQGVKARRLRPRSQVNNAYLIDGYLVPLLGGTALNRLKADKIQAVFARIQDDILEASDGKHGGARTVQALAQVLRAALKLAVKRRLLTHNPMDGVELPAYRPATKEPLSDAQVRALLSVAETHSLHPLWHLYALLGLRRGEGIGLRWADLDLDAAIVHVRQQIQEYAQSTADGRVKYTTAAGEPKYTSARTLPLPRVLIEPLRRRRADQLLQRARRANSYQDHDLVFANRDGGPLWPSNVLEDFYPLRAAAGAPDATIHTLRHTVATLLDECGASETLKAGILGHGKKTVTQRYTHARIAAMRTVLEQVTRRIMERAA